MALIGDDRIAFSDVPKEGGMVVYDSRAYGCYERRQRDNLNSV